MKLTFYLLGAFQEDAERLLKNSKRYDLLNDFYQSTEKWGQALETAEMYDRIHLRTTYYNYAKHLENKTDVNGAIPKYVYANSFFLNFLSHKISPSGVTILSLNTTS